MWDSTNVHLHHECAYYAGTAVLPVEFVSAQMHEGTSRTRPCRAALMRSVIYECLAAASEGDN